jgi:hypothetical protein
MNKRKLRRIIQKETRRVIKEQENLDQYPEPLKRLITRIIGADGREVDQISQLLDDTWEVYLEPGVRDFELDIDDLSFGPRLDILKVAMYGNQFYFQVRIG